MYPEPIPAIILPEPRERLAGWIYLPCYILIIPWVMSVLAGFTAALLGMPMDQDSLTIHANFAYGLANFAFAGVVFRRYLLRSARQIFRFSNRFLIALFGGVGIYFVGNLVMGMLCQIISPTMENVNDAAIQSLLEGSVIGTIEMVIFTVIFAPLSEEILFRGVLFTSLRTRSRVLAYVVTIVVFSAIHVLGYIGTESALNVFLSFIQYFPATFALIWAMEYGGSIWVSIGVHTIANGFAMLAMLLVA